MSITIKDILTLNSTKGFVPEAGQKGYSRQVEMIDMLDFGWNKEKEYSSAFDRPLFDERSFVITSLQFADGDPDRLYDTVKKLIHCGVSGLAYKPAFYPNMPADVVRLADESRFPIFRISDSSPYREIIVEVTDLIQCDHSVTESMGILSRMIHETMDAEEVARMASRLSPFFKGNARITAVAARDGSEGFSVENTIYRMRRYEEFKGKAILSGIELGSCVGLAVIATADTEEEEAFRVITRNVLDTCGIDPDEMILATSSIHPTFSMLDICATEVQQTYTAARVLGRDRLKYSETGTLSYLIPLADSAAVRLFMQSTLQPIILNEEIMRTAIAFVRHEGDHAAAADELCVHKNTLRYRINKIHELIAPDLSSEAFYENLATAVKVYLIRQTREG